MEFNNIKNTLKDNEDILWYKEYLNKIKYNADIKTYKGGIIGIIILFTFLLITFIIINVSLLFLILNILIELLVILFFLKFIKNIEKNKEKKYRETYVFTTKRILKRLFNIKLFSRDYILNESINIFQNFISIDLREIKSIEIKRKKSKNLEIWTIFFYNQSNRIIPWMDFENLSFNDKESISEIIMEQYSFERIDYFNDFEFYSIL